MFILSSTSSTLESWSVDHTSKYGNSESKVFRNIKFLRETSKNWQMTYLEQIYTISLSFADNYFWQYYNVLTLLQ